MPLVHAYAAQLRALPVDDVDVIGRLEHLHQKIPEHIGHAAGPALIAGRRVAFAGKRKIAVPLYRSGRFGLQDRVFIVADKRLEIGASVAAAGLV